VMAIVFGLAALAAFSPFLIDWIVNGDTTGHIQSLILGAILALTAVQMFGLGIVGDALAGQRVIAQRTFERVRRLELEAGIEPSHYEGGGEFGAAASDERHEIRARARGRDRSEVGV
jgi:hypothetical protein